MERRRWAASDPGGRGAGECVAQPAARDMVSAIRRTRSPPGAEEYSDARRLFDLFTFLARLGLASMRRPLIAAGMALALCHCRGTSQAPGDPASSATAVTDRNLFAYLLDDVGGFAPLPGSPFPSGGKLDDVESFSALPSRNLLFVASSASNSFSALRFDTQSGALVPLPASPYLSEAQEPSETAVSGSLIFVGHATSHTISSF